MAEELLQKIPVEKRWEITAEFLWRFIVLRGDKIFAPELGKGEQIIAPVMGAEKWMEINERIWAEGSKTFYLWVKEMFSIPVEDAVGAAKLDNVAAALMMGPEYESKIVEQSQERVVFRVTKCPPLERFNEFEVKPELRGTCYGCEVWGEGLKVINNKLNFKFIKTVKRGDPYCEAIIEFKEE